MLTVFALVLAVASPTRLAIEPWTGPNLSTATSTAIRYRLHVSGASHASLTLRADRLAKGWLAAFCTPKVCAPLRVDVTLPQSGRALYQFELIREDPVAAPRSGARISSSDGASITLSP
ncbi:MAG: hypothetical protein JOY69_08225 [Candidatus Eremiobacteraeota bacterium]|nr:hypothetical protein [Candidatus Eremiobacteraeota bacterium]MBV8373235.1 hypothetical protein [Candidatus Eremiobacteraeota bacterium]